MAYFNFQLLAFDLLHFPLFPKKTKEFDLRGNFEVYHVNTLLIIHTLARADKYLYYGYNLNSLQYKIVQIMLWGLSKLKKKFAYYYSNPSTAITLSPIFFVIFQTQERLELEIVDNKSRLISNPLSFWKIILNPFWIPVFKRFTNDNFLKSF